LNEKLQFKILTAISAVIIGLSVFVFSVGLFMYFNLGRIRTELPVKTVSQFRNIANIMPLVSELSSSLDTIQIKNQNLQQGALTFTINKIRVAQGLISSDFDGELPPDLRLIMDETSLLTEELLQTIRADRAMSHESAVLFKNRSDYIFSECRDYILRINNGTLSALEAQSIEIDKLKGIIFLSSVVGFCAAALTVILLGTVRRYFHRMEASRELAIASSNAKSEFLSNMSHEIRTPDERDHRPVLSGAEDQPHPEPKGLPQKDTDIGAASLRDYQRYPGLLEDRGGKALSRAHPL
jgi:signal transduction histidine kinase